MPYSEKLNIRSLQRLFDNMSECYKLFWFQAVVDAVLEDNLTPTYDHLINCMVADAWYMVGEFRLNLGPNDTLENLVKDAIQVTGKRSTEKRELIISTMEKEKDQELLRKKKILTLNVPYRLQAPFLTQLKGRKWEKSLKTLAENINSYEGLIYRFSDISGLNTRIQINEEWAEYIKINSEIIRGWIQYNLILYLQRRNPGVPGIPSKISYPRERKLTIVTQFWKAVMDCIPVYEIYGDELLDKKDVSIDHFVPWSYVTHDELWNLSPTTRRINSSKSNHLPDWDSYFPKLSELEYRAFELTWEKPGLQRFFQKCLDEHVNDSEAFRRIYRADILKDEFFHGLEDMISPVYKGAMNLGFDRWRLA